MSLATLLNQPLTIEHRAPTGTDQYGNDVYATTGTEPVVGYTEQTAATEVEVDRETYTTDWLVVLPVGTTIDGSDRIVYGTRTLEVIGSPHRVWNPRLAAEAQIECRCREVK